MNRQLALKIKQQPLQRGKKSQIILTGKYSYGAEGIRLRSWREGANCYIGSFCSIAKSCTIFLGGIHLTDCATTYPFGHINKDTFPTGSDRHPATKGHVIIHNDVWIGENTTLLSGIEIHNGAVITNGAMVTKDVPPYTIVGGNPAKQIRARFPDEIIDELNRIEWWNYPINNINRAIPLLQRPLTHIKEIEELEKALNSPIQ